MRRSRSLLLASALATALTAAVATSSPGADGPGEIVFASNRATANPGEIYALAPGATRRNLSRSPYADVALATSPKGRAYAFWSNRAGPWRLMISPDGHALRSVVVGGPAGTDSPPSPPVFSADGALVLIPYLGPDSITQRPEYAIARVRTGPARRLITPCGMTPALSPDGMLIACATPDLAHVAVSDLRGHQRFTVPGKAALWSPDGRLAVAGAARTAVLSSSGRNLAGLSGVARTWSPDGTALALSRPGALVLARPGRPGPSRVIYEGGNGTPYWVAFTPDGRDLVFAGGLGGPQMAAVAGGRPRAFPGQPFGSWSRDGRYAFSVPSGATIAIKVGDRLARKAQVIARLPYDGKGVSGFGWLGDGSALLYDGSTRDRADLWTMRADGSGQLRLTSAAHSALEPAWSPDGATLAYSSDGYFRAGSIVIASAQGRRLSVVAGVSPGEHSGDGSPSWAPDKTQVAVDDVISAGISVVAVAGRRRSAIAVDGSSPAWCPTVATIAFVDIDDGTVWEVAPTGADRHRLLPPSVRGVTSVAWSSDGTRLAYSTPTGIYLAVPDGTSAGRLVVAATRPGRPSFSPEGDRVAYAAETGAVHPFRAVFVVGVDGKGRRQLTKGPFDSFDPAWRP